jgi:ABC-type glycerol-3-phosphate transport system permease component
VVRHAGIYAGLTPFLVIVLFPLVWMTITAFKHEQDLYSMRFPLWFHLPPTLKHFRLLFTQTWFGPGF